MYVLYVFFVSKVSRDLGLIYNSTKAGMDVIIVFTFLQLFKQENSKKKKKKIHALSKFYTSFFFVVAVANWLQMQFSLANFYGIELKHH